MTVCQVKVSCINHEVTQYFLLLEYSKSMQMPREYNLHYKYLLWNPFFGVLVLTDTNQTSLKPVTGGPRLVLTCHYLWLDGGVITAPVLSLAISHRLSLQTENLKTLFT